MDGSTSFKFSGAKATSLCELGLVGPPGYFKAHKSTKTRARFVKLQNSQLATLKKKLGRCA